MDILKFKKNSEKVCHYCGKAITDKDEVTVDHVIPLSKGGNSQNDNLVIACKACNREKANLNADRYIEFVNIMNIMGERGDMLESVEKAINGMKEILYNFNGEIYAMKARLAAVEKKRKALLESMMFKKFNVVQGFDYAKTLRDMTEEIYDLKLNLSQMNKVQAKVNQITPFINSANPKGIKKEAVNELRTEIISDYYVFTDEKPVNNENIKEKTPAVKSEAADAEPEEQTG